MAMFENNGVHGQCCQLAYSCLLFTGYWLLICWGSSILLSSYGPVYESSFTLVQSSTRHALSVAQFLPHFL